MLLGYDGAKWTNYTLGSVTGQVVPITASSPNGLAYEPGSGLVYMASISGSSSTLYRVNVTSMQVTNIGSLTGLAAGATFYGGAYWYGETKTDNLHRVTFDGSGMVLQDETYASMTNGDIVFAYGDIDFDANGLLVIVSSTMDAAATVNVGKVYGTFDVGTRTWTLIRSGILTDANVSAYSQVAIGPNNVLYNHDTATGRWYIIDRVTGELIPLNVTSPGFTDIASVHCTDLTTSTTTATTTTTSTTSI